jgi:hypothetical protein
MVGRLTDSHEQSASWYVNNPWESQEILPLITEFKRSLSRFKTARQLTVYWSQTYPTKFPTIISRTN